IGVFTRVPELLRVELDLGVVFFLYVLLDGLERVVEVRIGDVADVRKLERRVDGLQRIERPGIERLNLKLAWILARASIDFGHKTPRRLASRLHCEGAFVLRDGNCAGILDNTFIL